jgi:hypothetical protein
VDFFFVDCYDLFATPKLQQEKITGGNYYGLKGIRKIYCYAPKGKADYAGRISQEIKCYG